MMKILICSLTSIAQRAQARCKMGCSWPACEVLAQIPWLRTHDLMLIRKAEVAHG